jgi:hypothetical protein
MRAAEARKAVIKYEQDRVGRGVEEDDLDRMAIDWWGRTGYAVILYRARLRRLAGCIEQWPVADDPKAGPMYNARRRRRIKRKAWKR